MSTARYSDGPLVVPHGTEDVLSIGIVIEPSPEVRFSNSVGFMSEPRGDP